MAGTPDPSTLVDRLIADPPVVHAMDFSDSPSLGVWSTDRSCYEFLARSVRPGTRSLETGSGVSTVLLAAAGAAHTCVTPSQDEADRILEYCRGHAIDTSSLTFEIGPSDQVLPGLTGDLDLVFVDGNHGYPAPQLDWYYGAARLVDGGLFVLDDTPLPAVAHLHWVLDRDPRWFLLERSVKWSAWRRRGAGSLGQDWFEQPWMGAPLPTEPVALAKRAISGLRRRLRRPSAA